MSAEKYYDSLKTKPNIKKIRALFTFAENYHASRLRELTSIVKKKRKQNENIDRSNKG